MNDRHNNMALSDKHNSSKNGKTKRKLICRNISGIFMNTNQCSPLSPAVPNDIIRKGVSRVYKHELTPSQDTRNRKRIPAHFVFKDTVS